MTSQPHTTPRQFVVREIGHVENGHDAPAPPDEIRAGSSQIIIDDAYAEGLWRLEEFERILVIFYFDRSEEAPLRVKRRYDNQEAGVFASHSPHRPNFIGMTEVRLLSRQGPVLEVEGLDALNGSPVLDLKPSFSHR